MLKRQLLVIAGISFFSPLAAMNNSVSFLEDPTKLLARDEFKKNIQNIGPDEAYDFLCDSVIAKQPKMMEDRFGVLMTNMNYFNGAITKHLNGIMGSIVKATSYVFGLKSLMVDGMVNEREPVERIFAKVCGTEKKDVEKDSLKTLVENELLVTAKRDREALLRGIGRFATGRLLNCIQSHKNEISQSIIDEMVEKKSESNNNDSEKNKAPSHPKLAKTVQDILEKCTDDPEGWKKCFEEMTVKAYANPDK